MRIRVFIPLPVLSALLLHTAMLVWITSMALDHGQLWGPVGLGLVAGLGVLHATGLYGGIRRLRWARLWSRRLFGFHLLVALHLLLNGDLAAPNLLMTRAWGAGVIIILVWVFSSFKSDPKVLGYFHR